MNIASGQAAAVISGQWNKASGKNSIAMGYKANANEDRSLVINLGKKGKQVSSNNKGEFLVNSDFFTIQIGKKEVTIDKDNINNFEKLLNNSGRRHLEQQPHIDEQQSIINELQEQNDKQQSIINELQQQNDKQQAIDEQQQGQIEQQQGQIEKQQEQINKLYRMMTAAQSTEN
mmetsp:Transcript_6010/g.6479  ORF Transcript_6010/g.6479 Transcript_6010/m.6479 type:complete len:174 (+) Transcript_6010:576-1097(+)